MFLYLVILLKAIFILLLVLMGASDLFAQEVVSLSTSATYGLYSESQQRDNIVSESVVLSYTIVPIAGLNLALNHSSLSRKSRLSTINVNTANLSYYEFMTTSSGNYIGGKGALHYIQSDDPNSNGAMIPYLSVSYKPESLLYAFEIGVARTPYIDTTAQQVSIMGAVALLFFDIDVWAQTRVTYINLLTTTRLRDPTLAVEERLYYTLIPDELTLSLYALFGERIYAYDADLSTSYNLPDTQKGSLGISLNYNLDDDISLFTDFTQEKYDNVAITNQYRVIYYTAGLSARF